MLNIWWLFLLFGKLSLAISNYELENTWTWKNPGVLGTLVGLGDNLVINLDPNGLLSTIDINNGDILHRFNYNETGMQLLRLKDGQFAVFKDQKVDFWSVYMNEMYDLVSTMTNQVVVDNVIINVQVLDDIIYIIQKETIQTIDLTTTALTNEMDLPLEFAKAKLVKDLITDSVIIFGAIQNSTSAVVANLKSNDFNYFNGCQLNDMDIFVSIDINVICNHEVVYKLDEKCRLFEVSKKSNLISPDITANSLIDDVIESIELIDNYKVINNGKTMYIINADVSESTYLSSFPLPSTYKNSINHSFIFKDDGVNAYMFISTDVGILECYRNGILKWSIDQSFNLIRKAVSITEESGFDQNPTSKLVSSESLFTRLTNSILSIFDFLLNIEETHENDILFGFNKLLVVLTENNKLGIFKLQRQISSQLVKVIDLDFQIDDIIELDNIIHVFSNGAVHKLDIETGLTDLISLSNTQFPLFELTHLEKGYTTEVKGNQIHGVVYNNDTLQNTWSHTIKGRFVSLLKRSYGNSQVAQSAVVLPSRDVLYKYLIPNLTVLVSLTDESIQIDILNIVTGEKLGGWSKTYLGPIDKINSIFEENYIILTFPYNSNIDVTEIVVIDLYESLKPNERVTNPNAEFNNFAHIPLPAFAMQSFILGDSVDNISISETNNNIAQRTLLIQTHGEVHIIPKAVIDGRRGGLVGDFKTSEFTISSISSHEYSDKINHEWKYNPALSLSPKLQLTRDLDITSNGNGQILTVPTNLASTSYLISITNDIFVTIIQPSGSFDKLTDGFKSNVIITTILTLVVLIILFHSKNTHKIRWVI